MWSQISRPCLAIALTVWNNLLADLQGACASERETEEEVSKFVGGKENMFVLDVCLLSSQKDPAAVCLALVIVCMCELVQCQPLFYRSLGDSALGLRCLLKERLCVMNSLQQCTVGMQVA